MSFILFADDNEGIRQMVRYLLRQAGHEVVLATDGREALAALEIREPDLMVLDLMMPRMTGLEVCQVIKSNPFTTHIPVLMLTAQSDIDHKMEGFEAGADDYLAKPFEPRELTARVSALLRMTRHASDRNPSSGLPGGGVIQEEMQRRVEADEKFAVIYIDLSNFKPFADNFGFVIADTLITGTGRVLREAVQARGQKGDFAGHIGGDDFIIVAAKSGAREIVQDGLHRFKALLAETLDAEALEKGTFTGADREGLVREFPLPKMVPVIVEVEPERWISTNHLGAFAADLKRRSRQQSDSELIVERV